MLAGIYLSLLAGIHKESSVLFVRGQVFKTM